jgi:hypothetical protein
MAHYYCTKKVAFNVFVLIIQILLCITFSVALSHTSDEEFIASKTNTAAIFTVSVLLMLSACHVALSICMLLRYYDEHNNLIRFLNTLSSALVVISFIGSFFCFMEQCGDNCYANYSSMEFMAILYFHGFISCVVLLGLHKCLCKKETNYNDDNYDEPMVRESMPSDVPALPTYVTPVVVQPKPMKLDYQPVVAVQVHDEPQDMEASAPPMDDDENQQYVEYNGHNAV